MSTLFNGAAQHGNITLRHQHIKSFVFAITLECLGFQAAKSCSRLLQHKYNDKVKATAIRI